ncbi:DUF2149 domain-containing protein [Methanobrevibacter sp.]|uniref:DUF2149 domain-containing protein n=1 Tax=Methanobrevibacter sp. TaxID=66852 RepID=UPI0026DEFCF4|nr:DUF2149 domain-containing protein [Methanobrevibacter sp.]MDO5823204.1 DUF2149 domain-containing protein [Methanobrevibacter sp.]
MIRRRKGKFISQGEEDPMTGTSNLVDAMLVISVGLLIFLVISWNIQNIVFNENMDEEQKQKVKNAIQEISQIDQGSELNQTPDLSKSSGKGFTEMGKVYKDSNTGKLIMVEG